LAYKTVSTDWLQKLKWTIRLENKIIIFNENVGNDTSAISMHVEKASELRKKAQELIHGLYSEPCIQVWYLVFVPNVGWIRITVQTWYLLQMLAIAAMCFLVNDHWCTLKQLCSRIYLKITSYNFFKINLQIYIIVVRNKKTYIFSLFCFENRQFAFLPSGYF